ncbi:MAG: NapC/NirT family cytochrome c [Actinobacteria bacterium]|nr:NapC/NirT family cytochrome c [Actinomycetota bacterium]
MPKGSMISLSRFGDMEIVIVSLILSLVFFIIFYFIIRSLLSKLGINRIYGLPIPLFLAIALAILVIFSSLSSHPLTCQACHPMRVSAKELRSSKHSQVSCNACHKRANVMSLPIRKLEQARMVFNYLRRDYKLPISATVGNGVCLSCHSNTATARGVKTKSGVMMSHREVIKEGTYCIECHEAVAHKKKAARKDIFMMERCSSCHNGEEASARCETCHLDSVWLGIKPSESWGINHDKNWLKVHGSRSLYICKSCHHEKDCKRCHSSVPHSEGWVYTHGEEAKSNREDCQICHKEESFCKGCHRITMPHPAGWLNSHKLQEKAVGRKVCLSCHLVRNCEQCHEKHRQRCGGKRENQ